jgi:hypothetical protein
MDVMSAYVFTVSLRTERQNIIYFDAEFHNLTTVETDNNLLLVNTTSNKKFCRVC